MGTCSTRADLHSLGVVWLSAYVDEGDSKDGVFEVSLDVPPNATFIVDRGPVRRRD